MKKEMKYAYVSPVMERTQIETESTFAGSVIAPENKDAATTEVHQTGFEHSFNDNDNISWE